jgi:hypothetical protein
VDIAGIDLYPTNIRNYPEPWDTTYAKAYEMMAQVAAGKMLALCETATLGSPERLQTVGPGWLSCLPWLNLGGGWGIFRGKSGTLDSPQLLP